MAEHLETGKKGEDIARNYLEKNQYTILETNWRSGHHELDLIAKKGAFLVVVEVKTRKGTPLLEPEVAVTVNKQRLIIGAANSYILKNGVHLETRFDIIAITLKGSEPHILHIEDAFYPRLQRG